MNADMENPTFHCPECAALWDFDKNEISLKHLSILGRVELLPENKYRCGCGARENHPLQHTAKRAFLEEVQVVLSEGHLWCKLDDIFPLRCKRQSPNFVSLPKTPTRVQLDAYMRVACGGASAVELCRLPALMRTGVRCKEVCGMDPDTFLHKVAFASDLNPDQVLVTIPSLDIQVPMPFFRWNTVVDIKMCLMGLFSIVDYEDITIHYQGELLAGEASKTLRCPFEGVASNASYNLPRLVELEVDFLSDNAPKRRKAKVEQALCLELPEPMEYEALTGPEISFELTRTLSYVF